MTQAGNIKRISARREKPVFDPEPEPTPITRAVENITVMENGFVVRMTDGEENIIEMQPAIVYPPAPETKIVEGKPGKSIKGDPGVSVQTVIFDEETKSFVFGMTDETTRVAPISKAEPYTDDTPPISRFRGNFVSTAQYKRGDVVLRPGVLLLAKRDIGPNSNTFSADDWDRLIEVPAFDAGAAIVRKNIEQDGRLDGIDDDQVAQDGRLDAVEAKNTEQDGRLDVNETNIAANAAAIALNASNIEWMYNLLLDVLVVAVKGAVGMASPTAFPALGGGWQAINLFDEERLTSAGVTFNLAADTFSFEQECEVLLSVGASFTHNETNGGRTTYVRLWNVTDGVEAGRLVVGIGRNVAATNFSSVLAAKVQAANVNDSYRLEIGGGDAVSAVTFQSFAMQITAAGAWLGPRPEIPT